MNKQVMIVDDEREVRETICRHLVRKGMKAVAASGCEECLEHLKAGFTGVIFVDLMMPEKDGWDTIREIVKQGYDKKTSLVLFTASMDPTPDKSKDLIQYVADYIQKPAGLKDIVETAKKYL